MSGTGGMGQPLGGHSCATTESPKRLAVLATEPRFVTITSRVLFLNWASAIRCGVVVVFRGAVLVL